MKISAAQLKNVSFKYANGNAGALNGINIDITQGECLLLCGTSGCGKTTVTRLLNGLIHHYFEGDMQGDVTVLGKDIRLTPIEELAGSVGSVFQNPRSQFFCVDTTSEIAFGCENLGLPEQEIRQRIQTTARDMNIQKLLDRSIFNLSGGEKQKIACASTAAMLPQLIVLDEPTSNLDLDSIDELRQILLMWKKQGKTIVIAEHRLGWLDGVCDRVLFMQQGSVKEEFPAQLSGGQQQRCAIARALIKNPKLLLCDEPTGALDSKTSRDILVLLEKINAKYGTTMLIVTHNNSIKNMVHKVIFLKDGLVTKDYENEVRVPAAQLEDL